MDKSWIRDKHHRFATLLYWRLWCVLRGHTCWPERGGGGSIICQRRTLWCEVLQFNFCAGLGRRLAATHEDQGCFLSATGTISRMSSLALPRRTTRAKVRWIFLYAVAKLHIPPPPHPTMPQRLIMRIDEAFVNLYCWKNWRKVVNPTMNLPFFKKSIICCALCFKVCNKW